MLIKSLRSTRKEESQVRCSQSHHTKEDSDEIICKRDRSGNVLFAVPAFAQTGRASGQTTNMEILMQKLKADKKLLVASNMELTDAESKAFWPLYDAYQKDLQK